jgi:hypothetical protein
LQQGINVLASVQSAGSGTLGEQEALRGMSPAQRMDIMRKISDGTIKNDGDLPEELRLQGVTVESLKKYGQAQDKYMFSRFMGSQSTPEVAAQVEKFRESGFQSLSGLKGKDLKSAFTKLAVGAKQGKLADTVDAAKAMLMERAAMENPALFKALKQGGIGDAAGGTEAKLKDNADTERLRAEGNLGSGGQGAEAVAGTGKGAQKGAQSMIALGQNFNASTTAVSKELMSLAEDINAARHAIRYGTNPKTKAK